jgi:hypothetical protein
MIFPVRVRVRTCKEIFELGQVVKHKRFYNLLHMFLVFVLSAIYEAINALNTLNDIILQALDILKVTPRVRRRIERGNRRFHIDTFLNFYIHFRMEKNQFRELYVALEIEDEIVVKRSKYTGMEALAITLYRLSYPYRVSDLSEIFARWPSEISHVNHSYQLLMSVLLSLLVPLHIIASLFQEFTNLLCYFRSVFCQLL